MLKNGKIKSWGSEYTNINSEEVKKIPAKNNKIKN